MRTMISNNDKPEESNPLISIIVISYNSAKTVLDTLDSAKDQDYSNKELIISDDGSKDNTIAVCKNWIAQHETAFTSVKLITAPVNTGIPGNCNRGLNATKGKWVKLIAADDILLPECLSENLRFIKENPDAKLVLSDMSVFTEDLNTGLKMILRREKPENIELLTEDTDAASQYAALLYKNFGNTPALFCLAEVMKDIGFDEQFRLLEDYPFALNATKRGYCYSYMNKVTVLYRISDLSVFASKNNKKLFHNFYLHRHTFDQQYRFPFLPEKVVKREMYEYKRYQLIDWLNLNHNNIFCKAFNKLTRILNPYA